METEFTTPASLSLQARPGSIGMFTSMLQAGIRITAPQGCSIGVFLASLPGFSEEYIAQEVQTIFLNGTATDDLETPLTGESVVLAISAAMPGLAGAIFRKNSLHAALRTTKETSAEAGIKAPVMVTLKLFNAIARDRGEELLHKGVTMETGAIARFLATHSNLFDVIDRIAHEKGILSAEELPQMLEQSETVFFQVV